MQPGLYLWQGDITTLAADAIVNAANSRMLGCFVPCHGCIDNAIHTYAGVQLRLECARTDGSGRGMKKNHRQGKNHKSLQPALPVCAAHGRPDHPWHAVTETDRRLLADCYRSCLELAAKHGLHSVAFCCISTGEFHFPNELAAQIAIQTVRAVAAGKSKPNRGDLQCFQGQRL